MISLDRIKALAEKKGHTFTSLERELGFGNSTIRKWEKNAPSVDRLAALAAFLETTSSYLLRETDDPDIEIKKIPSERGDRTLILTKDGENIEIDQAELSALIEQAKRETEPHPMPATADELRQLIQDEIKRVMGKGE